MSNVKKKSAKKWDVLIVEDDLAIRAELLKALISYGQCTTVDDGQKALETYRQAVKNKKKFDFILLDVSIPTIDGFDILKTIRAEEESANQQDSIIIMVTAYKDSLMANYNMGWDDYISKPIEPKKLLQRMQNLFSKRLSYFS
jgi:two-component system alkaline phosphatase synthesis response regulator PhoP